MACTLCPGRTETARAPGLIVDRLPHVQGQTKSRLCTYATVYRAVAYATQHFHPRPHLGSMAESCTDVRRAGVMMGILGQTCMNEPFVFVARGSSAKQSTGRRFFWYSIQCGVCMSSRPYTCVGVYMSSVPNTCVSVCMSSVPNTCVSVYISSVPKSPVSVIPGHVHCLCSHKSSSETIQCCCLICIHHHKVCL